MVFQRERIAVNIKYYLLHKTILPIKSPIGIFDSGYGGLTVFKDIEALLPQYDYLYLGDNARAPYGPRSFESVYEYTWQAVQWFFAQGCPLVILACNTASAKALRTIQQQNLPLSSDPTRRVLGVIRPTTEVLGTYSQSGKVGILGTAGTVKSGSYPIEIAKYWPELEVFQQSCPMWVPLIENNEHIGHGADYFVDLYINKLLAQDPEIDTLLLACTHYPLLLPKIERHIPSGVKMITQGGLVAQSLADYLQRHPEMEQRISRTGERHFFTTDSTEDFEKHATLFFEKEVIAQSAHLA
jgi:glutamate racemase